MVRGPLHGIPILLKDNIATQDLNAYLASLGSNAPIKSLAEAIAFNEVHADTSMPYFGQEIFRLAEAKLCLRAGHQAPEGAALPAPD